MENHKLTSELMVKVKDYLYSVKASQENQRELNMFLINLSPTIKYQVLIH